MLANSGMTQLKSGLWAPRSYRDREVAAYRGVPMSPALRAHLAARATLANDDAASGATVATHLVASKEHQVMMFADASGHIWGSKPNYFYNIASTVHVAAANSVMWDLFNADAALIIRVTTILQIPNVTAAVTGVVFDWLLERTTSVGTGGTGQTAWLSDLNQTALDADVTCRLKPSGGAAQSTDLRNYSISSEETNAATIQVATMGGLELIPEPLRPVNGGQGIVLRQNQGIRCVQVTNSNAGNTGWLIGITQE